MLERHSSIDEINAADVKQIYPSGDSRLRDRSDNFEAFWRIERASPTRCFHDQCLASYRMTISGSENSLLLGPGTAEPFAVEHFHG